MVNLKLLHISAHGHVAEFLAVEDTAELPHFAGFFT